MTFSPNNIRDLTNDLSAFLKKNEKRLKRMNQMITGDTDHWIEHDLEYTLDYLHAYTQTYLSHTQPRKPKGKLCIILSYNEPFILSVVPVLNALVVGNDVTIRPSSKGYQFVKEIWSNSGIADDHNLQLKVVKWDQAEIYKHIYKYQCLSFFGSLVNAKKLAQVCGEHYVEFLPEVEGADVKVAGPGSLEGVSKGLMVRSILNEAFSHAGQTCQRIHGMYVHEKEYEEYLNMFRGDLENEKFLGNNISIDKVFSEDHIDLLDRDIKDSDPDEVWRSPAFPAVRFVCRPSPGTSFVHNAYFLPTFWIVPYQSQKDLLGQLRNRTFRLGLNIESNNRSFIEEIIAKTNYARYTVNTSHVTIGVSEGWGGHWPTGFGGYKQWIDHYSNPYTVVGCDPVGQM